MITLQLKYIYRKHGTLEVLFLCIANNLLQLLNVFIFTFLQSGALDV